MGQGNGPGASVILRDPEMRVEELRHLQVLSLTNYSFLSPSPIPGLSWMFALPPSLLSFADPDTALPEEAQGQIPQLRCPGMMRPMEKTGTTYCFHVPLMRLLVLPLPYFFLPGKPLMFCF